MPRPAEAPSPRPFRSSRCSLAPALAAAALAAAVPACAAEVSYGPPPLPAPAAAPPRAAPAPAAPAAQAWPASDAPQADPEARRLFSAARASPPAALSQAAAPPRVTALALANTARGEALGMRAEEPIATASLREGERAALPVLIAPGECATFLAQGGLGVVEVDLFLTPAGAPAADVLVEDPTSGPIAVLGGRGACFPNRGAAPLQAELHVQLRRGGGVVLVQGYRQPLVRQRLVVPVPP